MKLERNIRVRESCICSWLLLGLFLLSSCATGSMGDQVLKDFRIRTPDPDTESIAIEKSIRNKLRRIGEEEMVRMNESEDEVAIEFEKLEGDAFGGGKFYKARPVYEKVYVDEVRRNKKARGTMRKQTRGYEAIVEFTYRIYQSSRFDRADDAREAKADLPSDETDRKFFHYDFTLDGSWDGKPGVEVSAP